MKTRSAFAAALVGLAVAAVGCERDSGGETPPAGESKPAQATPPADAAPATPMEKPAVPAEPFNLKAWKQATGGEWVAMARRISESIMLSGLTEEQVVELLGPPDSRADRLMYSFYVIDRPGGKHIPELMINFDRSGKVEKTGYVSFPEPAQRTHFSKAAWEAGDEDSRMRMALDVHERGVVAGKTRQEVLDLLGEPSREFPPMLIYLEAERGENGEIRRAPAGARLVVRFENGQAYQVDFVPRPEPGPPPGVPAP